MEYAFLLVAFFIPAAAGLIAGGVAMFKDYTQAKAAILRPLP